MNEENIRQLATFGFTVEKIGEVHVLTCRTCRLQWYWEGFGPARPTALLWLFRHGMEHSAKRRETIL